MHVVKGKVLLRDGAYITDFDATMRIQGIYIETTGRLAAVVEPLSEIEFLKAMNDSTRSMDLTAESAALRKTAETVAKFNDEQIRELERRLAKQAAYAGNGAYEESEKNTPPIPISCNFFLEIFFKTDDQERKDNIKGRSAVLDTTLLPDDLRKASVISRGRLTSHNCGVAVALKATPADTAAYETKAVRYSAMTTLVALVQVSLTVRQMNAMSSSTAAARLSLLCIGQQAVMDAFFCLMHLTLGIMVEPLFNSFATAGFVQFCLFGIFELRMLLLTWRARRRGMVDAWTLQTELSALYARFYGALLGSLLICYNLRRYMRALMLILHLFWIPQIVRSCRTDSRPPFLKSYVLGMSITRLVLPLYLFACPTNLLKVAPSVAMSLTLILLVGGQALIVLLQTSLSPRWFIPRQFLPPKYDYFRPVVLKGDIETGDLEDCVICMNPLFDPGSGEPGSIMVAPCDHFFHKHCLERWMAVKMECPSCRRALPIP